MAAVAPRDRVGPYLLGREIGHGAMATVFEAEHIRLGKRVALKRMHAHLASDGQSAARFLREGRAAAQIRSPHVVQVFDVGIQDGVPYLIMERLDGVDLAQLLRQRSRLTPPEVVDLMLPLASAISAAHDAGIIHRDLKPSNLFLARRGDIHPFPVVLDFGISKFDDAQHDLTASAALLGTTHYMSPEQTRGGSKATAASDQYALGVVLFECLTGTKPFAGNTPYAVMHAIVSARVEAPSSLAPGIPEELDAIVLTAMRRDPCERFPSVRALAQALLPWATPPVRERHAAELGVTAPAAEPRTKPRATIWSAIGALAAAAALAIGYRAVTRTSPPPARAAIERVGKVTAIDSAAPVAAEPAIPAASDEAQPPSIAASTPKASSFAERAVAFPARHAGKSAAPTPSSGPERGNNGALILE